MKTRRFRWEKVLLAVVAVYIATFLLITIITTGYGVVLGMQAQGAPDGERIAAVLVGLLTVAAGGFGGLLSPGTHAGQTASAA